MSAVQLHEGGSPPASAQRRQLALGMLDRQLLDVNGRRCGNVDDLELAPVAGGGSSGQSLELTALLSGAEVLRFRAQSGIHRWFVGLLGHSFVRVGAAEVTRVEAAIGLARTATELGLGRGDDVIGTWLERFVGREPAPTPPRVDVPPPAEDSFRLSQLLGRNLVGADGARHGCIRDVVAERRGHLLGEAAGNAWLVTGVVVGRGALAARLGLERWLDRDTVPVDGAIELSGEHDAVLVPPSG